MRRMSMIALTKLKIDDRGRITLPDYFLKANEIERGTYVKVFPVYNREDSVRLQFEFPIIKNVGEEDENNK
jgi:bifunctional DNA-binding transcriptional regulator/antitoxin component of YhaV-PrlF toxin-antitoxin module|tara:strand:- start:22 stop:234 length:213 start_codon:yes stop_codon:yes gene_type:complete